MKISDDEARALAFLTALIALTALGRWVDRPRAVLPDSDIDLAALTARSETALARTAGGRRPRTSTTARPAGRRASDSLPTLILPAGSPAPATAGSKASPVSPQQPLDLNRASVAELERLPGVGPSLAARIIARRDSAGPFRTLEQLDSVRGIGPSLLARLKPLLRLAR